MSDERGFAGVSFDLFGTLVTVEPPEDPATAVATALEDRGITVPNDWSTAYQERHLDYPDGAELPLHEHVAAALASRSDGVDVEAVRADAEYAVRAAFDVEVVTCTGAAETVDALAERTAVGVLSNCSVPGLVEWSLSKSTIDETAFDAVTTSVGCGWRKPDCRAFRAVARDLEIDADRLLHVGDGPDADGGAVDAGATALLAESTAVTALADLLEGRWT